MGLAMRMGMATAILLSYLIDDVSETKNKAKKPTQGIECPQLLEIRMLPIKSADLPKTS